MIRPITYTSYVLLIALSGFLFFYNLGDRLFWNDEAETALLAVNTIKYGVPKVFDGKNTISYYGPSTDANASMVWTWSPWLEKYLAAGSIALLGQNTVAGRLPFALIGFAAVVFFLYASIRIYKDHEIAFIGLVLFVSSEIVILHTRQCRYYSIIIFSQIWLIYAVYCLLRGEIKKGISQIAISLSVQFYSNYIITLANLLSIGIFAIAARGRYPRILRHATAAFLCFFAVALPWILYSQMWNQASYIGGDNIFHKLIRYLVEIHFHVIPLFLLLIPLVFYRVKTARFEDSRDDITLFLWISVPTHLAVLLIPPGIFQRYFMALIPVLILLVSVILVRFVKSAALRAIIVLLLCATNILSYISVYPMKLLNPSWMPLIIHSARMPIVNYISEITRPHTDRLKDVVNFFKINAAPGDSYCVPQSTSRLYDSAIALTYYLDIKQIDSKGGCLKAMAEMPDWIFSEGFSGGTDWFFNDTIKDIETFYEPVDLYVHNPQKSGWPTPQYLSKDVKHLVNLHNSFKCGSIPDPDIHDSFTSKEITKLVVYKKRKPPPQR